MNKQIKELAEQCWDRRLDGVHFDQEKFANLVAENEREECAKWADLVAREIDNTHNTASYIASGIRARGAALQDRLSKPYIKVEGPLHVVCQCDKCKTQNRWVGLTDEELIELSESGLYLWELWKAIEDKLKEKNT